MKQYTVLFKIEGGGDLRVFASSGESLLDAAQRANIPLDAPCAGNGTCGKCRVQVLAGECTGEPGRHLSPEDFAEGWRLACQSLVESDLTVRIPESARAYQSRIRVGGKNSIREDVIFRELWDELQNRGLVNDSGLELLQTELPVPAEGDAAADRERLLRGIAALTGLAAGDIGFSLYALRRLPQALREGGFSAACVIRREPGDRLTVLDIFPGGANPPPLIAGLAVDIGTTTVSALLVNLISGEVISSGSAGNGQIRYGADVINRIIESTRPGGLERLRSAITGECLSPLIAAICAAAGLKPEQIYRAAVAGNTTMAHLFLGISPEYLRLEPYVPAFFESGPWKSADLNLGLHPDAELLIAPAIGSYVGGDITAGVFASMIFAKETISLLVDLGTNGELVLGNAEFLMSCACSAGPAFEGGDISCGMRATDGAIEACRINSQTMEPELTIIGGADQKAAGLCGSGLIDLVGELFRCGIINARGKFIAEGERIRRDRWGGAAYVVVFARDGGTATGQDIALSESDIDNFIRAKGAIFSAIRSMLAALDFEVSAIENVYVAGGIGGGINMAQAIRIGMLPNLPLEKYHYIGNSSMHGAFAMLGARGAAEQITEISRGMTYLELSSHPGYMDELVAACFLPHTNGDLFEPLES